MSALNENKEGLEQIREILVGPFERDVERRVQRLEAQVAAHGVDIPQEARRRMDVIEAHMRNETEALTARIDAETADTREALRVAAREQRETTAAAEHRLTKLEELLVKQNHGLRQEILDQAKMFLDELQRLRADVTTTIQRELGSGEEDDGDGEEALRRERHSAVGESTSP